MSESAETEDARKLVLWRGWPEYMVTGHYFGLVTGPDESHGGEYEQEKADVKALQQRLIVLGYVPGITDPKSGWADGVYEQPTVDAVSAWQKEQSLNTQYYGRVYMDDWYVLFTF